MAPGAPEIIFDLMIVGTLTAGAMLIMWIGELITQRGIGNGMSLIIFANIMARPAAGYLLQHRGQPVASSPW